DEALRVRAEISAHGEATEVVRGKEKRLKPSFRIGLSIENRRSEPARLAPPSVEGGAGITLPVSRIYVACGGEPWDGRLGPRETLDVQVIGYFGEVVAPGTDVAATVRVEGLTLDVSTKARKRWNEPYSDGAIK